MVRVQYRVDGVGYEGEFAPHAEFHSVQMGEVVRVYYSPRDPKIAYLSPPSEELDDELPMWWVSSLLGTAAVVAGILSFVRRHSRTR